MAAAMTACGHTGSLSKDGSIMGPVAPSVSKALSRPGQGRGYGTQGSSRHDTPPTKPHHSAGSNRRGAPRGAASARWGSYRGRCGSSSSAASTGRSAAARKLDAGSGKSSAAATSGP